HRASSHDSPWEPELHGEARALGLARLPHLALLSRLAGREVALDAHALHDSADALGEEALGVESRAEAVLPLERDHRQEAAELLAEAQAHHAERHARDEIGRVAAGSRRVEAPLGLRLRLPRDDE